MGNLSNLFNRNWIYSLFLIPILIGISILIGNFLKNASTDIVDGMSMSEYAAIVIEKCSQESYKPGCYDTEIPKLMDYISMEEAIEVTRIIQETNPEYLYCHVLGHNVSAKETAKDPSKWKDVITRCPIGMCSNGCIHGAFQERFRTGSMTDAQIDTIMPELKTVCESRGAWSPTGMEKIYCYHAIGHLIMFITRGDIYKSNNVCEKVGEQLDSSYVESCFDGNFMQLFQPLAPEDSDLVKNIAPKTKEEAEKFCANFTGVMKAFCHHRSWPLYLHDMMTPTGLVQFCSYTEDVTLNRRCYHALLYGIALQLQLDVSKITEFCSALPDSKKALCFTNAAARMIELDYSGEKAASLCARADEYGVGDECYSHLIIQSILNYHQSSAEAQYLCDILPTPWKIKCEERQ